MRHIVFATLATFVTSCGGTGDHPEPAQLPSTGCAGTIPTYPEVTIFDKCEHCHASTNVGSVARHDAPPTINFDTYAAAKQAASDAVSMVQASAMPPSNSGVTITDEEKQVLYVWARCGTPE